MTEKDKIEDVVMWNSQQLAGPSSASCEVRYKLENKDMVLLDKTIYTESSDLPLIVNTIDFKMLRGSYTVAMGEQISNALKKNIEQAVKEVDRSLRQSMMRN
jgi:hypothetical protein